MTLKVDNDRLRLRQCLPAVHNARGDQDKGWALHAGDKTVDFTVGRGVLAEVGADDLHLSPRDGELIGMDFVQMPAFDNAMIGGRLVGMLWHNKPFGLHPWKAPEFNDVAAAINDGAEIFTPEASYCWAVKGGTMNEGNVLEIIDG